MTTFTRPGPAAPDLSSPIADELDRAVAAFDAELRSDVPFVADLVAHVAEFRGKLLRPRLLLLAGRTVGELTDVHVTLAAVVEMVHMATLVHDDVLDESDLRRRRSTVNRVAGNESAVLLGDYLISHAYHLCSGFGETGYARRVAAVTNTVCEGELMQIHHRADPHLSLEQYLDIVRRKTAALTGLCCELGARAAGAVKGQVAALAGFGVDLGVAFQIVDDVLDLTGSEHEIGKSVGRDAELGKWTLPAIRFRDRANDTDRRRIVELIQSGSRDAAAQLRDLLDGAGAIEESIAFARQYVDSALRRLECCRTGAARDALAAAAEFTLSRRL
jgi:octaprenyl-diphosphate synthase